MAFFDKLGKTLGNAAETATEKAKDFAETTKLNQVIAAEEKQINQLLLDLGRFIFENEKDNPESPVTDMCNKILASQQTIAELKQKIIDIKMD